MALTAGYSNVPAQAGGSGDIRALLLKIFSGEVIKIFDYETTLINKVRNRSVAPGTKTVQFPLITNATAKYHTPGDSLMLDAGYLNQFKTTERLIALDRLLTSSVFIDQLEESLTHFDARSEYTRQMALAMAYIRDKQLFSLILKAAKTSCGTFDSEYGLGALATAYGGSMVRGHIVTTGVALGSLSTSDIVEAIFTCARVMDEKNIPKTGRWAALPPELFYKIALNPNVAQYSLINKDLGGENGSLAQGPNAILKIAGISIVETNFALFAGQTAAGKPYNSVPGISDTSNKPSTAGGSPVLMTDANDYTAAANVTKLQMLVWHQDCLAAVQWQGMTTEAQYMIEYQGDLLVTKQVVGQEVLRPECAIAVCEDANSGTIGFSVGEATAVGTNGCVTATY